jgi:hypothetical protein
MRTVKVADGSRFSLATRYESLVGVSNAIGRHRYPQDLFSALVRELHRVVRFDYVGVAVRDENSNTFHWHFVDAETEATIPPGPELPMEESDAWWVYQNQEPLVTSLEAKDARFCKLQETMKKYGVQCACTLPLTAVYLRKPVRSRNVNVARLLGSVLLFIASIAVLLGMVLPVAASMILGLSIEVPNFWARTGKVLLVYSYPWVALLVGTFLLVVFGLGIWRLTLMRCR